MIKFILSGINSIIPLTGVVTGLVGTTGIFGLGVLLKFTFGTLPVTAGVPSLLAMLSWSSSTHHKTLLYRLADFLIHILLPAICMIIFMTHPASTDAWPYALYWVIPMALWAVRFSTHTSHPFIHALQSTFVAHAVGSVMWVFLIPTSTQQWLALIPLVAIERLTIAAMSTVAYQGSRWLWHQYRAPQPHHRALNH